MKDPARVVQELLSLARKLERGDNVSVILLSDDARAVSTTIYGSLSSASLMMVTGMSSLQKLIEDERGSGEVGSLKVN